MAGNDAAAGAAGTKNKAKPKRLGRGLSSLLSAEAPVQVAAPESAPAPVAKVVEPASASGLVMIDTGRIVPNKFQPRGEFDEAKLAGLANSIHRSGLMQPVVVRPSGPGYELVAGERRWRAAMAVGVVRIPAVVRELSDQDAAEWALVENEQREDLNPVERARACRVLHESFGMSHAEIGVRLGIDRSSVSNLIRLLELGNPVLELLRSGRLSLGHGKALLAEADPVRRERLARRVVDEELSVRALEALVSGPDPESGVFAPEKTAVKPEERGARPELVDLQKQLESHLGSRVKLKTDQTGTKGRLEIPFDSLEHFDSLMDRIGFRLRDE